MAGTQKKLRRRIIASVHNGTFFQKTESKDGHIEKHISESEPALLDRVLSVRSNYSDNKYNDKKNVNTGFMSVDDAYQSVENAVMLEADHIAEWVINSGDNSKKSFYVKSPQYETVGRGYMLDKKTNCIKCYDSDTLCIVLKKDNGCELGFTVLTAYPDITKQDHRHANIDTDVTKIVKRTKSYKKASPVCKAYMLCQADRNNPYLVTFKDAKDHHDDVLSIQIPYADGDEKCRHTIRIKENKTEFSTSKLMDVQVARRMKSSGNISEKIIYPGEDVGKYRTEGTEITTEKKYIKQRTAFVDKYSEGVEPGVDLTNKEAFDDFRKLYPEAARLVIMCREQIDRYPDRTRAARAEMLDESLLPREMYRPEMQFSMV